MSEVLERSPSVGEEVAVLETAQGRIVVMFFPDIALRSAATTASTPVPISTG